MRRLLSTGILLFILGLSCLAQAETQTWNYTSNPYDTSIANDGFSPNRGNWYNLSLPDWYDSNYVTKFTIDMYGYNDNSSLPIDFWLYNGSLNPNTSNVSSAAKQIVGYDVTNGTQRFILELNLMDNSLYRNYKVNGSYQGFVDTGKDLQNIDVADFDGKDSFWIGYACHFTLDKTSIHIEQQQQVPEPTTMALLGFGLLGIAGIRKRFIK